jgi:hypothetical protein
VSPGAGVKAWPKANPKGSALTSARTTPHLDGSEQTSHYQMRLVGDGPPTFGGGGVVDGAELLVTLPGHVDFAVGVAGLQTLGELGLLAFGQMLHTVAEEAADLVERVVLVPSVAEGVLLDAAADLVDDLRSDANDVEGVEDRDRVGQLVTDSAPHSHGTDQRGLFDGGGESVGLVLQPRLVGGSGAADDRVEKPGVEASPWSRVRSTMIVTARSVPTRDGRHMCSSTPKVLTPARRSGTATRALASVSIAVQAVCQATPR